MFPLLEHLKALHFPQCVLMRFLSCSKYTAVINYECYQPNYLHNSVILRKESIVWIPKSPVNKAQRNAVFVGRPFRQFQSRLARTEGSTVARIRGITLRTIHNTLWIIQLSIIVPQIRQLNSKLWLCLRISGLLVPRHRVTHMQRGGMKKYWTQGCNELTRMCVWCLNINKRESTGGRTPIQD
jgi:hypothetical protein